MSQWPLKWRISLMVASAILAAAALNGVTAYLDMKELLIRATDHRLQSMTTGTFAVLDEHLTDEETKEEVRAIVGISAHRRVSVFRVWIDGNAADVPSSQIEGEASARILDASVLARVATPAPGKNVRFDCGKAGDEYRAIWARSRSGVGATNVAIAESSHYIYEDLAEYRNTLLWGAGSMLLMTIAAATLLVWLGLRPIGRTAQMLSVITERNVGEVRIEPDGVPVEIKPFVRAVSDLLARLAKALQEQKRFVSDASHELRTPLSVAQSTIDATLVKERTPREYRAALAEIHEDLDRMGRMIEELLVLARLDETMPERELEPVELAPLIESVAEGCRTRVVEAGGMIRLSLSAVTVRADSAQLMRLFSNLLDNAVRHGPKGGVIEISIRAEKDGVVVICVHDEGGAIPADALPHLFERFYRADPARSRSTGGTGLGLSIAREIALRHGGDITASSAPEEGTSFCVRLPTV